MKTVPAIGPAATEPLATVAAVPVQHDAHGHDPASDPSPATRPASSVGASALPRSLGGLRGTRTRILLAYVLLLTLSLGLVGFAARTVLIDDVTSTIEARLRQEVEELNRLASGNDPTTAQPFGEDLPAILDTYFSRNVAAPNEGLYSFVDGEPYLTSASPPAELTADPAFAARMRDLTAPERGQVGTTAGPAEYLAVPLVAADAAGAEQVRGVFVVAEYPAQRLERVDSVVGRIALVLLGVLALASALAYVTAGRVLAPLRRAIETARSINENDLSARMPVSGADETAELALTFNDMLDRVERALDAQREFVSDAGHELRTPLTIVRGHLEVMTDDPADREETIALVLDELDRMARLVNDLLLLSRSERPDFLDLRPVALHELLPEVFAKVSALATDRTWLYDGAVPAEIGADPQRLTQALTQLAQNAVQHTEPGAVIALGSSRDGDHVHIWVRDEGEGIAAADRERVFERFARATAQPRRSDGHGLGLAIVTAVVESHGGRVRLDSELGRGSTFRLVLPVGRTAPTTSTG